MEDTKIQQQAETKPGIIYPQDYTLKSLVILSPTMGSLDVKASMVELTYFEDLFSNICTGRVVLTEAGGYATKMQLTGNEYIRMTFTKGSDSKNSDIDKIFRIYKMAQRGAVGNIQTEGYALLFCSDEFLISEQYKISKSYPNKKISEIIKDICGDNYLKVPDNKKIDIEETQGIYDFVIPNLKPFEAINWLANYAQTAKGSPGADMLFFENRDGYNFASLQTLFKKEKYKSYVYEPKNMDKKTQPVDREFYSVLSYEAVNSFDTLESINNGTFANRLISIDPITRKYSVTDFNYKKYNDESTSLNKNGIVNDTKNRKEQSIFETAEAKIKVAVTNAGLKDNAYIKTKAGSYSKDIFLETFVPNRTAQFALANYNKLKLLIDGDPGASVGSVIEFTLMSTDPQNYSKQPDPYISGRYLVTAAKHTITVGRYVTVLEISKDSAKGEYHSPNDKSSIWQNSTKGVI